VPPGRPLALDVVESDGRGVALLAHAREPREVEVPLGAEEQALLAQMPWPLRRAEWLAGRRVMKQLLQRAFGLAAERVQVLPAESGAPLLRVDGALHAGLTITLSHTHGYAVAAAAAFPVGVDVCDDVDGPRLPRIARRVFNPGEAEACGAHASAGHQAAVWALKEAGLKLRIGGVFDPGARAVHVLSLEPARVKDSTLRVELFRLPAAAVAIAVDA
jgi:phosphopantetheinyl transferase